MAEKKNAPTKGKSASGREDRLKSALKANLARRKAQARARSDQRPGPDGANQADGATGKPER